MGALVDLHLHTTASDGRLTPTQLIRLVAERGLRVVSITDHDSTEGLAEAIEAAQEYPQLTLIPGVELSVDVPKGEVHLLGYSIDYRDRRFQETLHRFRDSREERARGVVEKLSTLGVPVEWERVKELAGDAAIGRPHIAQAMVEKGYITYVPQAFDTYLGRNGLAYVERPKLTLEGSARLILEVGGLPVLAHPALIPDLDQMLLLLKAVGVMGMEVYYAQYSDEQRKYLARLAAHHQLLPCGGSDYHAFGTPNESQPGDLGPPLEVAEQLIQRAQNQLPSQDPS